MVRGGFRGGNAMCEGRERWRERGQEAETEHTFREKTSFQMVESYICKVTLHLESARSRQSGRGGKTPAGRPKRGEQRGQGVGEGRRGRIVGYSRVSA